MRITLGCTQLQVQTIAGLQGDYALKDQINGRPDKLNVDTVQELQSRGTLKGRNKD